MKRRKPFLLCRIYGHDWEYPLFSFGHAAYCRRCGVRPGGAS